MAFNELSGLSYQVYDRFDCYIIYFYADIIVCNRSLLTSLLDHSLALDTSSEPYLMKLS